MASHDEMNRKSPSYDIIIVGGGTAGCVLANRLSEDPDISILLLEAGENHNHDANVYTPGLSDSLRGDAECDWQYVSIPQPGINDRQMVQPRGKMLGGSSAINSFAFIYPSADELDAWADLGNDGWNWSDMKRYYRKFQTICAPGDEVREKLSIFHNDEAIRETNGPVQASFPVTATTVRRAWVETFRTLGLENTKEALDGHALGGHISTCHITHDKRERSHAGNAYYEPVRDRPNLKLVAGALVKRLVFSSEPGKSAVASGVEYFKDGTLQRVSVKKEVLLAAGAFATPQLLELSGIGNPSLLQKYNIPTVYNNPHVGENLQDHIRPGLTFEAADDVDSIQPLPLEEVRRLYEQGRTGPWAERACHTFAYMPLVSFLSEPEKTDLSNILDKHLNSQNNASRFEQKRNAFIRRMVESPQHATATAFLGSGTMGPDQKNWFTLFAMLSHPFSSGSVHIQSPDPTVKPVLDFGYYTHPLDLEIHARHLQSLEKLATTEPLASSIKKGGERLPVGADALTLDRAKELIKGYATTNYHPCGSCSMMPEEMGGVVDDRLRVYGTNNVRVVDASIFPIIPRGNIITTVYAVAEKAADIISRDLGIRRTT